MLTPLLAMIRKDLRVFFADRRSVIMAFAVPIAIASFFGSIFSGAGSTARAKVSIGLVNADGSAIARGIVSGAQADESLAVTLGTADQVRDLVRAGRLTVGVVVPQGFGEAAGRAFFAGTGRPELTLFYDPSHPMELAMVRGVLTQHVMEAVTREMFSGATGDAVIADSLRRLNGSSLPDDQAAALRTLLTSVQRFNASRAAAGPAVRAAPGLTMPYTVHEEAETANTTAAYNGYAHSFAGMGIQFLLFAAANLGIDILLERQRGLWKRLRSAPLSRTTLLLGKAASGTTIALMTLLVSFGFAMVVFHVRIQGSEIGFLAVALACSLMASTFGILIAALGKTPGATRGVASFAVLIMVMLSGAWVPSFVFPQWLQQATLAIPTRWAVDGLDAMTWRGLGLPGAFRPTLVLLAFALVFWTIAVRRFRWDEA
jgi:ABC-2 type transport system permease protein